MSVSSEKLSVSEGGNRGDSSMTDTLPPHEEHERRFLVDDLTILEGATHQEIKQAYLWAEDGYAVRVRLTHSSDLGEEPHAYLTLKGPHDSHNPYMRYEVEQVIDPTHAEEIIQRAEHVVTKRRYAVIAEGKTFDVDVFTGRNEGLVIAEFEGSPKTVAQMNRSWFTSKEVTQGGLFIEVFWFPSVSTLSRGECEGGLPDLR